MSVDWEKTLTGVELGLCSFCGRSIAASLSGEEGVMHAFPLCPDFERLSPVEFLRANRTAWERRFFNQRWYVCDACMLRRPREEKTVGGLRRPGRCCSECGAPIPEPEQAHLVTERHDFSCTKVEQGGCVPECPSAIASKQKLERAAIFGEAAICTCSLLRTNPRGTYRLRVPDPKCPVHEG